MILLTRQLLQIKQKQKHVNSKTQRVKYLELNDILSKKKTATEVSFEWSHRRISFTDSKIADTA